MPDIMRMRGDRYSISGQRADGSGDDGDKKRPPDKGGKKSLDGYKLKKYEALLRAENNRRRNLVNERETLEQNVALTPDEIAAHDDLMGDRQEIYGGAYATIHYMRTNPNDITGADDANLDDNMQQYENDRLGFNAQADEFNRNSNIIQRQALIRAFNGRVAQHNANLLNPRNRVEPLPELDAVPSIDHTFYDLYNQWPMES